jgi:Mg2+ and Co2+ transporter CorA
MLNPNLHLQQKLNAIIRKIDNSPFSKSQKEQLKNMVFGLLKKAVLPVMVKHMPGDKLKKFTDDPQNTTIDQYGELYAGALDDNTTMPELLSILDKMLDEIHTTISNSV